jgi:hypothetical protein
MTRSARTPLDGTWPALPVEGVESRPCWTRPSILQMLRSARPPGRRSRRLLGGFWRRKEAQSWPPLNGRPARSMLRRFSGLPRRHPGGIRLDRCEGSTANQELRQRSDDIGRAAGRDGVCIGRGGDPKGFHARALPTRSATWSTPKRRDGDSPTAHRFFSFSSSLLLLLLLASSPSPRHPRSSLSALRREQLIEKLRRLFPKAIQDRVSSRSNEIARALLG